MYLTYAEYEDMGGQISEETAFQQLEFEARTIIDWWTFNRLQNETNYPEAVKRCMLALISLLETRQKAMVVDGQSQSDGSVTAGIASESNDGVSASYNTLSAKDAVDAVGDRLETTVRMYLANVRDSLGRKVLYRGLYPDE